MSSEPWNQLVAAIGQKRIEGDWPAAEALCRLVDEKLELLTRNMSIEEKKEAIVYYEVEKALVEEVVNTVLDEAVQDFLSEEEDEKGAEGKTDEVETTSASEDEEEQDGKSEDMNEPGNID